MATAAVVEEDLGSNIAFTALDVTLSNSYEAPGGEEVSDLPSVITLVLIEPVAGFRAVFDRDTRRIQMFVSAGTGLADHEVAAGADLSAVVVRIFILHPIS